MADHDPARGMSEGEKRIWAASYTASVGAGCNLPTAIRLATRAVERLRAVDITGLPPAEQLAVREMRHHDVPDEGERT